MSDDEKRLRMIETVLSKGSTDPFHHYAYAMELRSLGRLEPSLEAFKMMIERFGAYVPSYLMAAQVALELNQTDEAQALLAQGIAQAQTTGDEHALSELQALAGTI